MSFWQSKTKIRRADKLFSDFIRQRDNWHCVYKFKCNGIIDFSSNPQGLTNSHFQKRRHENTRYDPKNCDSACRKCHRYIEDTIEGIKDLEEWKKKQLGEKEYKLLIFSAHQYKKRDDKLDVLMVNQMLKQQRESI